MDEEGSSQEEDSDEEDEEEPDMLKEEDDMENELEGEEGEKKKSGNKNDPFDGMTKQERQKLVKEQNRERRANKKMDKNEKKR